MSVTNKISGFATAGTAVPASSPSGSEAWVELPNDGIQQIMVNGKPLKQNSFGLKAGMGFVEIE